MPAESGEPNVRFSPKPADPLPTHCGHLPIISHAWPMRAHPSWRPTEEGEAFAFPTCEPTSLGSLEIGRKRGCLPVLIRRN
jgi:hypothetical protein